jgi:hypothetical protein
MVTTSDGIFAFSGFDLQSFVYNTKERLIITFYYIFFRQKVNLTKEAIHIHKEYKINFIKGQS